MQIIPIHKTCLRQGIILFLWIFFFAGATDAFAQFAITEDFRGSGNPQIVIGDGAYLTSGVIDPVGAGYLRLTNDENNKKGFAYINQSFPSTMGVLIDFEYKMWRDTQDGGNGADGIGIFLFDGSTPTFTLGGYGGSLGYAPNTSAGTTTGLAGGYVGIGLDAYGNFGNNNEGRNGRFEAPDPTSGEVPNAIVMRGPTTSNTTTTNRFLKGVTLGTRTGTTTEIRGRDELDYNTITTNRPADANFYRRVQIEIVRVDEAGIYYKITVRWKKNPAENFTDLMEYTTTDVPPALLKLGFAASTGGSINNHDIRNLLVTTPGNLRVLKRADKDLLRGNIISGADANRIVYTVEVTNDTEQEVSGITFTDKITDAFGNIIPEGVTPVTDGGAASFNVETITTNGFVSAAMPDPATLTSNLISGTLVLAPKTTGRVTITGRLYNIPPGNVVTNTATALPTFDEDKNNNTSVVRTPVVAEGVDLVVTKTVAAECITSPSPTFTVYASNIGALPVNFNRLGTSGTRVAIFNEVPANYTYSDAATEGGFTTSLTDPENGNTTARWSKITMPGPNGSTIYGYIARGTSTTGATETLGAGMTYPYPVKYTITPPAGTASYIDKTQSILFTDLVYTSSIEPSANRVNNASDVVMSVKPAVAPTIGSSTIYYCPGEQAVPLVATKTNQNYSLKWYVANGGFSSDFAPTPSTNTAGTYIYQVSQVNGNCEGPKATITVIVAPAPGTITPTANVVCPGGNTGVTGTAVTGTYRWEKSVSAAGPWTSMNVTTQNLTSTGALTETTYFRRIVTATNGTKTCEATSNVVAVTVPNPGTIGYSQTFCTSDTTKDASNKTTVTPANMTPTGYQWQRKTTTGNWENVPTGWQTISNNVWREFPSSGTTEGWNPPDLPTTYMYRRISYFNINGSTCTTYSNEITVATNGTAPTAGGSITASATTVCKGATPAFTSTAATGTGVLYQWQSATTSNGTYSNVSSGGTGQNYTPAVGLQATTFFRRRAYTPCGEQFSNVVQITVNAPTPGSIGTSQTICYNTAPAALTSPDSATETYRWESATGTSGGTWATIAGTGPTINPGVLQVSKRYRRYKVSTVNGVTCESDPSNEVIITVKAPTDGKTIGPAQSICNGTPPAALTGDPGTGDGAITYQWQFSLNGIDGWNTISGQTGLTYTPPSQSRYYRRVTYANNTCEAYSNVVLITYQNTPQQGSLNSATICNNTSATVSGTAGSGSGNISYRWESSTNNTSWTTVANATGATLSTGNLSQTMYYRRFTVSTVLGNTCESPTPAAATITVMSPTTAGAINGTQSICFDVAPAILGSATDGTGTGISYKWEVSSNGTNWAEITGATASTYQAPVINSVRHYRRKTIGTSGSVVCESGYTNVVIITPKNCKVITNPMVHQKVN